MCVLLYSWVWCIFFWIIENMQQSRRFRRRTSQHYCRNHSDWTNKQTKHTNQRVTCDTRKSIHLRTHLKNNANDGCECAKPQPNLTEWIIFLFGFYVHLIIVIRATVITSIYIAYISIEHPFIITVTTAAVVAVVAVAWSVRLLICLSKNERFN